jgi:putative transposase
MSYPSDLTDEQWELIRPCLEYENGYGNRRKHPIRQVLNGIFYVNKTGCQWRMLPNEFPPWQTVYIYFSRLCERGKWEEILDALNQKSRQKKGRNDSPTLAIVDAQSVKTTAHGDRRGYDGGKKNQRTKTLHRSRS